MKIYNPYDPPGEGPHVAFGKSLTRQSEAEACDINVIMRRYEKTGILPEGVEGFFADVSNIGDYRAVQEKLEVGKEIFYQLPAVEREKFRNDVGTFLDFAADPGSVPELVRLGLLPKSAAAEAEAPLAPMSAPGGAVVVPPGGAGAA